MSAGGDASSAHDESVPDGAPPGPEAPTYEAGRLIDGRFRVVRLIGRGGMSEVYRVVSLVSSERLREGEELALKVVMPELLRSDKAMSRFEREMRWTQRIGHPNVIDVREFFRLQRGSVEVPCLVMELLDGDSLVDHLEKHGVMTGEEAKPIVCQMAAALDAAHRAGIVHRDLKPANVVLVPRDGQPPRVVLTDFGVARENLSTDLRDDSQSLTASNVILGTPDYLAPEQLELEEALPASDIYALGLCFYQMVTGSLPFESDSPLEAVFQRVQTPAPSPRLKAPDLDPVSERVILRCLERDMEQRYALASEVIRELDGSSSDYMPLPQPAKIRPEVWVSLGAIAVLVVIAVIVAMLYAG